jgi:hypothetical protein
MISTRTLSGGQEHLLGLLPGSMAMPAAFHLGVQSSTFFTWKPKRLMLEPTKPLAEFLLAQNDRCPELHHEFVVGD